MNRIMNRKEIRYIKFEIGVDGINTLDDVFEMSLPITAEEIDELISIGKRQMWEKEDEPWDYIHDFMPKLYNRFLDIVKPEALKIYGSEAENAYYDFFIPDEISEKIWESEEADAYFAAQEQMETNSKTFWNEDKKTLYAERDKGRWKGKAIVFDGIWHCGDTDAGYVIHITNSIEYVRKYTLKDSVIEIDINKTSSSHKLLEKFVSNSKYKNEYEMSIVERPYTYVLVVPPKNNGMDIELVMDFIDSI